MERKGMYIYGILNSNASPHLSIPKDLLLEESESNGVYTIAYQDISALLRDSEIVDYTHMRKDILARQLLEHQSVIEGLMSKHNVIPVKLGTFAQDADEVKEMLSNGYRLIKEILGKTQGKIEIDLACTWSDFTTIVKEAGEETEIKEFKEKVLASPKGISADDQMKAGFMLKKALNKKRDDYAKEIEGGLREFSQGYKKHELMDDRMLINTAFLINKTKRRDFESRIEELNSKMLERVDFRCVGPLPPYSFYTLEIQKIRVKDLEWARKKLKFLNSVINRDEVKKAYQRIVFFCHPDQNPNTPGIEREFNEVNRAYKMLIEYCQAYELGQAGREERDMLLLKLKD